MPETATTPRPRPFANGTEADWWFERNCVRCVLAPDWPDDSGLCEIDHALGQAMWGDGTISPEIATEMGYPAKAYTPSGERYVSWDCPKRVALQPLVNATCHRCGGRLYVAGDGCICERGHIEPLPTDLMLRRMGAAMLLGLEVACA